MQQHTLKIENARFIVTMDQRRRILTDGAILVEGRDIARVGKTAELADVAADRTIDAREMVVTPGFVNGHMHVSYAHATRGIFPDDLSPGEYLSNVFKLQGAMTEVEEYYTTLLGLTELLKYGTTTFLDPGTTNFLDACMDAYELAGTRIVTGRQVVDKPNPLNLPVSQTDDAIRLMEETVKTYDGRLDGRMRAWAMPFAAEYASAELLVAAKRIADEYGVGLTLHQGNAAPIVDLFQRQFGIRPVEYLESIGVLGQNVLLAHSIGLGRAEIAAMVRTETKAIMAPTAAMKMGSGLSAMGMLPEMLEAGLTVGLGTDAANNANLVETIRSMYLIAVLFKDARRDTRMVPAETALEMATVKGAEALGLGDEIGSIEVGKRADIVLFDTRRPEWRTLFNPVNSLVYGADGRSVDTVIVDGRIVVEDHMPVFVDEWPLIQRVQELGEGMLARTGVAFPSRWPIE